MLSIKATLKQIIDPEAKTVRRRFASETRAWEFANHWRHEFWSRHFDHPDAVHNRPDDELQPAGGDAL